MSELAVEKSPSWAERVSTPLNTLFAFLGLLLTLVGAYVAYAVRQSNVEQTVTRLEKKTEHYDALIETRTQARDAEREEIRTRLARLETRMDIMIEMLKARQK